MSHETNNVRSFRLRVCLFSFCLFVFACVWVCLFMFACVCLCCCVLIRKVHVRCAICKPLKCRRNRLCFPKVSPQPSCPQTYVFSSFTPKIRNSSLTPYHILGHDDNTKNDIDLTHKYAVVGLMCLLLLLLLLLFAAVVLCCVVYKKDVPK